MVISSPEALVIFFGRSEAVVLPFRRSRVGVVVLDKLAKVVVEVARGEAFGIDALGELTQ